MALTELRKALTSAGDGAALNDNDIDPVLHEELLKLQPLAEIMSIIQSEGKTHEYKVRSSHPLGWFEGEVTPANNKNGVYARKTVQLKIMRQWGSVSGFAKAVDAKFINALEEEIMGSLEGMSNLFEFSALHGIADDIGFTGDAYQFSGILPRVFSYAAGNIIDAGGAKVTLDMLDQALAKAAPFRQVRNDPRLWLMGLRMKQVVDGLQTKVQMPLNSVELADGKFTMAAYGDAPIYETDYLVPASSTSSPACTAAIAAGGALPDGTRKYRIASVTVTGEQVAGTESANCVNATTNNSNDLSWTPDAAAYSYMIFVKLGSGAFQLLDIIPALTYDAAGTVNGSVAAYSDEGAKTAKAIEPLESGEQQIVVVNVNQARGASFVGLVDDMGQEVKSLVSFVELARVKDSYDYMLKSYLALRLIHPNLVGIVRHVKTA